MFSIIIRWMLVFERRQQDCLVRENRARLSSFLSVVQINPGLNVIAIAKSSFLLRLVKLLARLLSPAALSYKRIPDGHFIIASTAATRKAAFEDSRIRFTMLGWAVTLSVVS